MRNVFIYLLLVFSKPKVRKLKDLVFLPNDEKEDHILTSFPLVRKKSIRFGHLPWQRRKVSFTQRCFCVLAVLGFFISIALSSEAFVACGNIGSPTGGIDTNLIQDAIDSCVSSGGGDVYLSSNTTYVSGMLKFKNNVNLYLNNSTLQASTNIDDFPEYPLVSWSKHRVFIGTEPVSYNVGIYGLGLIEKIYENPRSLSKWLNLLRQMGLP